MEDWLKCQISPLVKYRQNPNQTNTPEWITWTIVHIYDRIRSAILYNSLANEFRNKLTKRVFELINISDEAFASGDVLKMLKMATSEYGGSEIR